MTFQDERNDLSKQQELDYIQGLDDIEAIEGGLDQDSQLSADNTAHRTHSL